MRPAVVASGDPPRLVARLGGRTGAIAVLEWNGTAYAVVATGAQGTQLLAADAGTVFAVDASGDRLLRLDDALTVLGSVATPPVGALDAVGGRVYAATNWNLTAYDLSLQQFGRVRLDPPHPYAPGKALDGLAVVDGSAYVLDDVVMPFYVFRVDVAQPVAMQVRVTYEIHASSSPRLQFVDPGRDRWYVERNFHGMGGGSTSLVTLRASDGAEEGGITVQSSFTPFDGMPGEARAEGYQVRAYTVRVPGLAVLDNGTRELAFLRLDDEALRFSCPTPLDGAPLLNGGIAQAGGWAAVALGDRLWTVDVAGVPRIVAAQGLPGAIDSLQLLDL